MFLPGKGIRTLNHTRRTATVRHVQSELIPLSRGRGLPKPVRIKKETKEDMTKYRVCRGELRGLYPSTTLSSPFSIQMGRGSLINTFDNNIHKSLLPCTRN